MSIKHIIYIIIFSIFVGISLWVNHKFNSFQNEIIYWQNQTSKIDTIKIIDSTSVSKLTIQVKKLSSRNKDLQKELNKKNSKIQSQLNIIGILEDSIKNISTHDSVINDTMGIRTFDINMNDFFITGYFQKQFPYEISFTRLLAKFNLEANIVQNKNKSWSVYIDTKNSSLKISDINTKVIPYSSSFKDKILCGYGIYLADKFSELHGIIGYKHYIIQVGYSTNGIGLGLNYKF